MARLTSALVLTAMASAMPLAAQTVNSGLDEARLFGIDHDTGALRHYLFSSFVKDTIGTIAGDNGQAMTGIEAAGYFPGFGNLFALWQDPDDGQNKLLYVRITDAKATVLADNVEGGKFAGAAAVHNDQFPYTLFTVQQEVAQLPAEITGVININPSNSSNNEFTTTTPGGTYTRDDLHQGAGIDSSGTFYEGPASSVFVKPKGNGNQVTMNDEPVNLQNGNTYTFNGDMEVRIYNDKPKKGKAMGHWHIEIVSGTALLNDEVEVLYPNRLATVDHKTGAVSEVMLLSRPYHGLATQDGVTFYTEHNGTVYRINTADGTETVLTHPGMGHAGDLEFIGSRLLGYDRDGGVLADIDLTGGGTGGMSTSYGVMHLDLGETDPIVFAPAVHVDDPTYASFMFD